MNRLGWDGDSDEERNKQPGRRVGWIGWLLMIKT